MERRGEERRGEEMRCRGRSSEDGVEGNKVAARFGRMGKDE